MDIVLDRILENYSGKALILPNPNLFVLAVLRGLSVYSSPHDKETVPLLKCRIEGITIYPHFHVNGSGRFDRLGWGYGDGKSSGRGDKNLAVGQIRLSFSGDGSGDGDSCGWGIGEEGIQGAFFRIGNGDGKGNGKCDK